jgi:hypothetical protein
MQGQAQSSWGLQVSDLHPSGGGRIEAVVYRLPGSQPDAELSWRRYAAGVQGFTQLVASGPAASQLTTHAIALTHPAGGRIQILPIDTAVVSSQIP